MILLRLKLDGELMIKRLCFDMESSYFKDPLSGVGEVESHREYMREKVTKHGPIRFDCAVVYDDKDREYLEFQYNQAAAPVDLLETADELISRSGKRHDLLVLEQVCGEVRVAPLWQLTHYDLFDLCNWSSLDNLARHYIPVDRLCEIKRAHENRLNQADERWPEEWPNFRPPEHFIEKRLSKARFDVERTYLVFEAYLAAQ